MNFGRQQFSTNPWKLLPLVCYSFTLRSWNVHLFSFVGRDECRSRIVISQIWSQPQCFIILQSHFYPHYLTVVQKIDQGHLVSRQEKQTQIEPCLLPKCALFPGCLLVGGTQHRNEHFALCFCVLYYLSGLSSGKITHRNVQSFILIVSFGKGWVLCFLMNYFIFSYELAC